MIPSGDIAEGVNWQAIQQWSVWLTRMGVTVFENQSMKLQTGSQSDHQRVIWNTTAWSPERFCVVTLNIDKIVKKYWSFERLKNSCSYWLSPGNIPWQKCCSMFFSLPRPVQEWKRLLRQLKHKPAPGSSTNTCDWPPTWLSKMGKLKTRVPDTSQTVGIDYHLFKSETKVGQLQ